MNGKAEAVKIEADKYQPTVRLPPKVAVAPAVSQSAIAGSFVNNDILAQIRARRDRAML